MGAANSPDDVLKHFGVKGMKWGTRRDSTPVKRQSDSHSITTAKGERASLEGMKVPMLGRGLAAVSSSFRKKLENSDSYHITNSAGKRVGELNVRKDPAEHNALNVVWVETHDDHKGKGYATAAMKKAIDIAKKQGRDKVTLEVPGKSPDARHIYEKLGFKSKGAYKGSHEGDIWGGLTRMELDLRQKDMKHFQDDSVTLTHFGVKGMRWGHRKSADATATTSHEPSPQSEDSARTQKHLATIEKHGVRALSNKELQEVVSRMNLVSQYSNLTTPRTKSAVDSGHDAAKKALALHKTAQGVHKALTNPATKAAIAWGLKKAFKTAAGGPAANATVFAVRQLTRS